MSYGLNHRDDTWKDDPSWFPVTELWCQPAFFCVVLGKRQKNSILYHETECQTYEIRYKSLTHLLMHCADWLEASQPHQYNGETDWYPDNNITEELEKKYMIKNK